MLRTLVSLLSLLQPLVGLVLGSAGAIGLVTCAIYWLGPPHLHFPMGLLLGVSIGCLALSGLYIEVVQALQKRLP